MAEFRLPKNKMVTLLVIALVAQALAIAALTASQDSMNKRLNSQSESLYKISVSAAKANAENAQIATSQKVVVDPINQEVYLPEFRIKLPYDETTKALAYSVRDMDKTGSKIVIDKTNAEADITSLRFSSPPEITTMNCANLVRLKVEAAQKPYSPHEKATTVKLVDGRSLQVYEFVNAKECQQSWSLSVAPSAVAAEFQKAKSY